MQSFIDTGNATGFFKRLGVPTGPLGRVGTTTRYVDFESGTELNFTGPAAANASAALSKYRQLCEEWEDLLLPGYFNFPEPADIPEDMLLPFGEFATKHGIEAAVPTIFRSTGLGVSNVSKQLTVYVMQAFGAQMARALLGLQASFGPASNRNQDLYDAAAATLGDDVLFSSIVTESSRSDTGVTVTVTNQNTGAVTHITAKRLLIAISPTPGNIEALDFDDAEKSVFSKFQYSQIQAGIVSNAALPVNFSISNLPASATPNNYITYPDVNFTVRWDYIGANKYFRVMTIGDENLSGCAAKTLAQTDFDRLVGSGIMHTPASTKLQWVDFADHGPMHFRVSAADLKAGFVQDQYALQGKRSTWYTGGAFSVQFQTTLWEFNDIILPDLVAGL